MERLEFDLLFRCFVGLGIDDPGWDDSSFTKNRDRLLEGEIAAKFLAAVLAQPQVKRLLGPTPARRIARWLNHLPRRRRNRLHRSPVGNFFNSQLGCSRPRGRPPRGCKGLGRRPRVGSSAASQPANLWPGRANRGAVRVDSTGCSKAVTRQEPLLPSPGIGPATISA